MEIIDLLLNNDIIKITLAFIVFVLTNIIKKALPQNKTLKTVIIPFILGIIIYAVFGIIFIKGSTALSLLQGGVEIGGMATLIFAIVSQTIKSGSIEKTLTKILKGVLTNSPIKNVVADIIDGYSEENTHEENAKSILMLLISNTTLSEEECKTITDIIMKAFLNK
jgi:hypothetical protein